VSPSSGASAAGLVSSSGCLIGRFTAMACPCEVLVDTSEASAASAAVQIARDEAMRIEHKFSRYRDDNLVYRINHSKGQPVAVDEEMARLIDYAATCHALSDGRFDITSGVLRRVWTFDGGERVPTAEALAQVRSRVGWHRVRWEGRALTLQPEMEIDFGGIGKEYAVDRAAALIAAHTSAPALVNFGGDLYTGGPRRDGAPWMVGIDDPARTGEAMVRRVELTRGGLATSGDARRYVMHQGKRLGHILDPRTGWPVEDAPHSVTVVAATCLEAGTLSTLATLCGAEAETFLKEQGVTYWIV
jgi:thiamine biosynthesis lipoprotein